MGNTNFDPTGEKKARKKATFGGAIFYGFFNTSLGVLLGFCVLATTAPFEYKAKADAKTGKVPPLPAGLYYWAGSPGGDFMSKESQFLAAAPGSFTVADSELNAWSGSVFKFVQPKPKTPAATPPANGAKPPVATSETSKMKDEAKEAEADLKSFGLTPNSPNFHVFHDPAAPADVLFSFQIAVPMTITLLGVDIPTVYQARGTFVPGPQGPQFQPYASFFGNARIPAEAGLAKMMFNSIASKFAASDPAKKYSDVWVKFSSATVQDGGLALTVK
jgi:hypothetical protein